MFLTSSFSCLFSLYKRFRLKLNELILVMLELRVRKYINFILLLYIHVFNFLFNRTCLCYILPNSKKMYFVTRHSQKDKSTSTTTQHYSIPPTLIWKHIQPTSRIFYGKFTNLFLWVHEVSFSPSCPFGNRKFINLA